MADWCIYETKQYTVLFIILVPFFIFLYIKFSKWLWSHIKMDQNALFVIYLIHSDYEDRYCDANILKCYCESHSNKPHLY